METLIVRAERAAACRAPWAERGPVVMYWDMAAACLRRVRAEPPAVSAFLPLSPLIQCVGSAGVVVYFCCAWGGKGLPKEGEAFIAHLCELMPGLDRPTFDAAVAAFSAVTGCDVRGFGPSTYEVVLTLVPGLTRCEKIRAARACLILARRGEPRGAIEVAMEVLALSACPEGRAGNLAALLAG